MYKRIGMFLGVTAVLLAAVFALAQTQPATADVVGGPSIYLPVIVTPSCEEYFDDFSDPNSGWIIDDDDFRTLGYVDDEYSIASKVGGSGRVLGSVGPLSGRENYVVAVEAHFEAAPTDGFYGVMFGVKREGINDSVSEYYLFAVEPDTQEYGLFYRDPSANFTTIVPQAVSGAINMGTAVNRLTAVLNNHEITLKVNDITLGTWPDNSISGDSQVGVAMRAHPSNPVADARFDNFSSHICILAELNGTFQASRVRTPATNRTSTSSATIQDEFPNFNE